MPIIVIVDYRAGNIASLKNMLKRVGHNAVYGNNAEIIKKASRIILPGVGHFDYGMRKLRENKLVNVLKEMVLERKVTVLGMCLGIQLMARTSEEGTYNGYDIDW